MSCVGSKQHAGVHLSKRAPRHENGIRRKKKKDKDSQRGQPRCVDMFAYGRRKRERQPALNFRDTLRHHRRTATRVREELLVRSV